MRSIRKLALILGLLPIMALSVPGIASASVFDSSKNAACAGLQFSDTGNCSGAATQANKVNNVIALVINILSVVVGVAAVIVIIISGLKFITSGGDSSSVASAKNGIIYAIVGLVVAALAQMIVRYVLKRV